VQFPAGLKSMAEPHVFFEQLVAEQRLDNGTWRKIRDGIRNEAIDLMVMAHVMAHLFGLTRISWDQPPAWARPWDVNSLVFRPDPKAEDVTPSLSPRQPSLAARVARSFADRLAT